MIHAYRRFCRLLCVSLIACLGSLPVPAPAVARGFNDAKYAAIVVDATSGEVLYARNADSPRYPASITKIMTLYLTFQALSTGRLKLTDRVSLSPHAAAQPPTKLGLAAGESVSVDEAIRAMCTLSANDMAVAMAEKLGGTEAIFAALMTQKAHELGMAGTHYADASGLPNARQISSARDIAILSRTMMRDFPQYYPYFSQESWTFRGHVWKNHNHLLGKVPGVDGIKTGLTNASGFNLAASAVRDGRRLITVVLGGPSGGARDNQVERLLDVGFDVMRRRQQGEQITVAQRLFEEPGPTPYVPLTPDPASGAPAGAPIRQAMAPVPDPEAPLAEPPIRVADARAPAHAQKAGAALRKKKDRGEGYTVQVGSFRQKNEARRWLTEVTDRFEARLADATGSVVNIDGRYRSRFEGLSHGAAEAACRALHAHRLACTVLRGD